MKTFAQLTLVTLLLFTTASHLFAQGPERSVEFRDGTILRLRLPADRLPWHTASRDGTVVASPLSWKNVDELYLVTTPALEKLAEIKGLLNQLSSAKYIDRVEAHKLLIEKGIHFRGVVEEIHKTTTDPEVRWRLDAVMKAMSDDAAPAQFNYDLATTSNNAEPAEGDVGKWEVTANFRDTKITINRDKVCRIRRDTGEQVVGGGEVTKSERIPEDEDDLVPKNVTRIDFDRGPQGEILSPGKDIRDVFISLGCTIEPLLKESKIAVQDYNVRGRSGKFCVANHDPLYQGEMLVRFCMPGNAGVPAGVHVVGFWTAYIEPNGTALEAYDVHDRLITVVKTRNRGRDFLCVKSNTPIAYVKITTDEEIDKDFAIDDLVFDPPVTLADASDPEWLTVLLTGGERIKCRDYSRDGDKLTLNDLSVGIDKVTVPLSDLVAIMPPGGQEKTVDDDATFMAMLTDGSIVRATAADGELKTTQDEVLTADGLVALWGMDSSLTLPDDTAWPTKGAVMVVGDQNYKIITKWTLGKEWIESKDLGLFDFTYAESPIVWFTKPPTQAKTAGMVRLAGGVRYVLDKDHGYTLKNWTHETVTLTKGDRTFELPQSKVLALRLPRG